MSAKKMTDREYKGALASLKINQREAADVLCISLRSSNGYANGEPIPAYIARLLRAIIKFNIPLNQLE